MKNIENTVWNTIAHFVMIMLSLFALLPFVLLCIASFTDNNWATANGFSFFPQKLSLGAFQYLWNRWDTIGLAYLMTIIVTITGTVSGLFITAGYAYALSNRNLPGNKLLSFLSIFTMLFNGGIVATYYSWIAIFHVRDTIWALVLPNLIMNAFRVMLMRNYFMNNVPSSILESARIEGGSEFRIFGQIVIPLSIPIFATISLMTGIAYWNDWINGMYYLTRRHGRNLYTIQLVLNSINENINFLAAHESASSALGEVQLPTTTMRMAIAVVGILPMIAAYPFLQRYFVKGITLGGVKG